MAHPSVMTPTAQISEARCRAELVRNGRTVRRDSLAPTEAAHALAGVISWIQRQSGLDKMRSAALALASHEQAWTSNLSQLPHDGTGVIDGDVALLAVVCRGIIELAGAANLRAAVSFWATESDPSEWQRLFAA